MADEKDNVERRQIERRLRMRPAINYEVVREGGEEELARGFGALWWSGVAAGLSISFSMVVMGLLQASLPKADWAHPIAALGYTAGFVIVILARQQLFTENTITALLPVMSPHSTASWWRMIRLWTIVLGANLVGACLFAVVVATTPLFTPDHREAFLAIAEHLFENDALAMFVKGIGSGWLIAALVWVLPSAREYRMSVVILLTWIISLAGFTHIVAGTTEAMLFFLGGHVSLFEVVFVFALPTLAGNIVGGSALFALISYAQVKDEVAEFVEENGA